MQDESNQFAWPYLQWHYSRAVRELLNVAENIERFIFHFFSIKLLLSTFWSPWRRLHENYEKKDIESLASSLLVNTLMRLVGAITRSVLIVLGSLCSIAVFVLAIVFFAAWIIFPVLLLAIFISGGILIFSAV